LTVSAAATIDTRTVLTARTAGGRLGALAGLAFAVLFLLGTAMLNIPHGASDQKLVAWWSESGNQLTAVVSMYSSILAGLCFLAFLVQLRSRLLTAEGGTGGLTTLVVASGAVFVAMLFVAAAAFIIVVANAALVGMIAIPAMLVWALATSAAMWRGAR
jgi:hypothetical protein